MPENIERTKSYRTEKEILTAKQFFYMRNVNNAAGTEDRIPSTEYQIPNTTESTGSMS